MLLRTVVLSSIAAFLASTTAHAGAPDPGVTNTEVVIGATGPLSGPGAAWGSILAGAEAWANDVNAQGGVHGRKIRFVQKDDGFTPARAVANVNELKDSVFALFGLIGTANCNAAKDVIADAHLPMIFPLCSPTVFARQPPEKLRTVFMAYPVYVDEAEFLAQEAAAVVKAKKVALFYQNDEYGQSGLEGVKRGLQKAEGVTLAGAVPYELADREMGTQALKLKESGADAVILYSTPTHAAALVKEMARVGYRPTLLAASPLGDRHTMFRLLGDLWEGAYYAVNGSTGVPGEPEADRVLATLVKQDPKLKGRETFAITGAIGMMAVVEALQRAGRDLTREKFLAAFETIKDWAPHHLMAPITWAPGRHHGANTVRLMRAKSAADSSFTVVAGYQQFRAYF